MRVTVRHSFESSGCPGEKFYVSSSHTVDYSIRIEKPSDLTAVGDPYHQWLTLGNALYCDEAALNRAIFGLGVSVEAGGNIYEINRLVTADNWSPDTAKWLTDEIDYLLNPWWALALSELESSKQEAQNHRS